MSVYTLNVSSANDLRASILAAIDDAGILTTNHYNTSNDLIVTTTRSNKVIKFNVASIRPSVYYGDAYTSGTTITNQVVLVTATSATIDEAYLIVTGTLMALVWRFTSDAYFIVFFGKSGSVSEEYLALSWGSTSVAGVLKDTTNDTDVHILSVASPAISPDGKYYELDLPVLNGSNVKIADSIQDLKSLTRSSIATSALTSYGDVVTVSGGYGRGLAYYFRSSFIIEDAVEWPPA
jgi:hypothetical protein